jgi:hypothetical protein
MTEVWNNLVLLGSRLFYLMDMTSGKLFFFSEKISRTEYTKWQSEVTEKTRNSRSDVKLFRMVFSLWGLEGVFLEMEIQAVDWGT